MVDRLEARKDTIQVAVESAFRHVGQIASIITGAGREVTREIGEWATEVFEMREAARLAQADEASQLGSQPEEPPPLPDPGAGRPRLRRPRH